MTPTFPTTLPQWPKNSDEFTRSVAEDAALAAQRALGADFAACLLIEGSVMTDALVAGGSEEARSRLVEHYAGLPVEECPVWSALQSAGGRIYTDEDCADADGPIGVWARDCAMGAVIAAQLGGPPANQERTGMLVACYEHPREISPEDADSALAVASVTALAISGAVLYREAMTKSRVNAEVAEEQAALRRVATAIARGAEPATIFNMVAEEAARLLDGETASVTVFDDGHAEVVGRWGTESGIGVRYPLVGNRSIARVARTGRAARTDDYARLLDEDAESRAIVPAHYGCGIAAPIWVGNQLWGAMLTVRGSASETFAADAEFKLQRFSDLVSLGISGAQIRKTLEEEASTDPLTNLPNRRLFERRLRSEAARAERYERDLSLAIVDIDHFKSVNDSFGHEAGDEALKEVAERLRQLARQGELVARIGGEEFAWLLPETDAIGALTAAERARRAVASEELGPAGTMTVSVGVCSLAEAGGARELMGCADRALYWAKARGRDVAVAYSDSPLDVMEVDEQRSLDAQLRARSAILALARTVDAKDHSTLLHSERVADLACRLAGSLGWSPRGITQMREAGLLHDVGKIGVPDEVLQKRGRLSADEYELVRTHPALGAQIACEVLTPEQASWIRGHHERWDGTGYPDRLAGTNIPEGARVLALADAWDTMTSARPYQQPTAIDDALAECQRQAGRQFCPAVVAALRGRAQDGVLDVPDPGRWVEPQSSA